MQKQEEIENEAQIYPLPSVYVGDKYMRLNSPLRMTLDAKKLGSLLASQGLDKEQIEALRVYVVEKNFSEFLEKSNGVFDPTLDSIFIYPDEIINYYAKLLEKVEDALDLQRKLKRNDFSELLTTRRLSEYLMNSDIPYERRYFFAEKLLREAAEREIFTTVIHESKHKIDFELNKLLFECFAFFAKPANKFSFALTFSTLLSPSFYDFLVEQISQQKGDMPLLVHILLIIFTAVIVFAASYRLNPIEVSAYNFQNSIKTGRFADWDVIKLYSTKMGVDESWYEMKQKIAERYQV